MAARAGSRASGAVGVSATGRRCRLDFLDGAVDAPHEIAFAEDVDGAAAAQRVAHGAPGVRDDQPDATRVERVVYRLQCLRARHVHLADRSEVEDDRAGWRLGRANAREQVVLEEIGIREDQLRLEAMDQRPGNRRGSRIGLDVTEARAVAAAPERGDVRVVDRVDQQDEAEGDADRDARKDVDEDHAEQGAERRPELERLRAPVLRDPSEVHHPRHRPDHPVGTSPTIATPRSSRSSAWTASTASTTTMITPGSRGANRASPKSATRPATPTATVVHSQLP